MRGADACDGGREIGQQDDVAIDVAEDLVAGDGLGAGEKVVQALGAVLVALDVRLVAESKFPGGFGGAIIGAKKDDLDVWVQGFPGLQGVALDDASVADKGFGGSEEGQHGLEEKCQFIPERHRRVNRSEQQGRIGHYKNFVFVAGGPPPRFFVSVASK